MLSILTKIKNFIKYKVKNPYKPAFEYLENFKLDSNSKVIDIGAHKGKISEFLLKKGCTVYAYEPNPYVYKELKSLKKKYIKFFPQNIGVFYKNDFFKMYFKKYQNGQPKIDSEGNSLIKEKKNVSSENYINVKCFNFKSIISKTGKVDLVKVDIEGAEYEIYHDLLDNSDSFNFCIMETHEMKLSTEFLQKHEEMIKTIKSHKNSNKFKFDYV